MFFELCEAFEKFELFEACKKINVILQLTEEVLDVNISELHEQGFTSIYKTASPEKARETVYELLPPETLPSRKEVPHPVPYRIADMQGMN